MSPQVTNNSCMEHACCNVDISTREAPGPESKPMENTALALAIRRCQRDSATPICVPPPPRNRETRTFRELFIASLVDKPATSHESTVPALSPATITDKAPSDAIKVATPQRVFEKFDAPRLNVDKEEFRQDVKEYGLRTLKDSRWAKNGAREEHRPEAPRDSPGKTSDPQYDFLPALRGSGPANSIGRDTSKQNPPYVKTERKFQPKKQSGRDGPKYNGKTPRKFQGIQEHETPREPPRLLMDKEEFARDVEKYNLKTLKDSRWA
ncbi:hypothetical protein F5Y03DRAFT_374554 [Xylaria venustula]|nr:hypothetical protein F5Y03DRAFT_374554 [Xylaria venustula]